MRDDGCARRKPAYLRIGNLVAGNAAIRTAPLTRSGRLANSARLIPADEPIRQESSPELYVLRLPRAIGLILKSVQGSCQIRRITSPHAGLNGLCVDMRCGYRYAANYEQHQTCHSERRTHYSSLAGQVWTFQEVTSSRGAHARQFGASPDSGADGLPVARLSVSALPGWYDSRTTLHWPEKESSVPVLCQPHSCCRVVAAYARRCTRYTARDRQRQRPCPFRILQQP